NAVADIGVDFLGLVFEQRVSGVDQRAAGIDDVIDQDTGVASDIANHIHHFGLAGALAPLVDDGKRSVDTLRQSTGPHHTADVRRHHHHVVELEAFADVAKHHWTCIKVVGRNIEEALNLAGVQIERHHAVGAGTGNQVGDQLCRDRCAWTGFAVLPCVSVVGDHGGDAARRRTPQRVDDNQQLHEVVVGREGGRLDHKNVGTTHVFLDLDENLH